MDPEIPDLRRVRSRLRAWFVREQRDLPWRRARDPYAIWVSEVMLQQTRVSAVVPHYERFMARFPDVRALAAAHEDDVIASWAGLGYYARGRNLHRAAQSIVREHGGRLPATLDALRVLPGVGEYTARAVASIAFGEPLAVVDGNVERVLCRLHALRGDPRRGRTRRIVAEAATRMLDPRRPGDHNQALMELGATVCLPKSPACQRCPVAADCRARESGDPERFPEPRRRRAMEEQHWLALLAVRRGRIVLVRNSSDAELLAGHWGVPMARCARRAPRAADLRRAGRALAARTFRARATAPALLAPVRHSITHRRLVVHRLALDLDAPALPRSCRTIPRAAASGLAALYRKIVEAPPDAVQ